MLTVQIPNGAAFTFGDGGLCSDYLESEQLEHCVTTSGRNGQVLLQADYSKRGIGPFCLRMVCHISKATARAGVTLSYTVLIFPGTAEQIMDVSDLARSPSWPGMRLAEGELALTPYPGAAWQCPVLPMLMTGTPWTDERTLPTANELADKIGWIMATSEPADPCRTNKEMLARWQKYANQPDDFNPKRSPLTWPQPQQAEHTGRHNLPI